MLVITNIGQISELKGPNQCLKTKKCVSTIYSGLLPKLGVSDRVRVAHHSMNI